MPDRSPPSAGRPSWRADLALPVLALLAVWVLVLYRRAFAVGVLSDGWVLLEIGSRGLRKAPFALLSYHTIPVTNLFMAVLWKLFGLHERLYQAANLAELTLVGWLLYQVGLRLFGAARVALLASLLFLANSSFYEVPFWPTVGNFQSLAAMLYLAGILAVIRAYRSPRPLPWLALFSLCSLAAFFTYEPAVSLLGVGLLYAALVPFDGTPTPRDWARRALGALGPALPAVAVVLGSKLYTSSLGYQAAFLPRDWAGLRFRVYLLARGCVAIFSLRGADHRIYRVLSFGLMPPGDSALHTVLVAVWVLGLSAAGLILVWRTRSAAVRFVTLWFAAHMLTVSAATDIVSRHFYLGALPAALLMSWLIWSAADRLSRSVRVVEGQPGLIAGIALALLVAGSLSDLETAAVVHREASAASRRVAELVQQRLEREPGAVPRVALVNMPAILAKDGIGAFAFVNGLYPLLYLSTGRRVADPDLFYTYAVFADGKFANGSRPISLGELGRRARDPGSLVVMFDPRARTVSELDRAAWRAPAGYDADSAPYLEWQPGAWPWFRVYAGQPLEMPLAVTPERSWVAVRYLRKPGVAFSVTDPAGVRLEVRAPEGVTPSWPTVTFPAPSGDLTLRSAGEVWLAAVRSFSPPADYAPETAPFLSWILRPFPQLLVEAPVRLPLATPGCEARPCALRIEYLAERGRELSLAVGGKTLDLGSAAAPEWRSGTIPLPPGRQTVVGIEPRGALPALVRRLGWETIN
jgi:hypothetical protein